MKSNFAHPLEKAGRKFIYFEGNRVNVSYDFAEPLKNQV